MFWKKIFVSMVVVELVGALANRVSSKEAKVEEIRLANLKQLTTHEAGDFWPVFSPDNKKIVFYSTRTGNRDIFMMNVDGTGLRQLTSDKAEDFQPGWSTDGERVVFSSNRKGSYDIWIMNADGTHQKRLTNDDQNNEYWPRWSPIMFAKWNSEVRKTEKYYRIVYYSDKGGEYNIWTMRDDGTHQEQITKDMGKCMHPEWAPDGLAIVFDVTKKEKSDLFIAKWNGPVNYGWAWESKDKWKIKQITEGQNYSHPAWSANKENVIFVSEDPKNPEIYITDRDGKNPIKITHYKGTDYCPHWSPDGKKIAFTSFRDKNNSNIFIANSPILLSNIVNLYKFTQMAEYRKKFFNFDKEMMTDKLSKNRFVSRPGKFKQYYHLYKGANYPKLPVFITTDSILHTYHIFFDYTLRILETKRFYDMVDNLSQRMLKESLVQYRDAPNELIREAAKKNVGFFAVGVELVERGNVTEAIPSVIQNLVKLELEKIEAHSKIEKSSILNPKVDYTQFIPRGHYTRTETLKNYFRTMMWYAQVMFRPPYPEKGITSEEILQSLLIYSAIKKSNLFSIWDSLYTPILFFVGGADDLSIKDYKKWVKEIYGDEINLNSLTSVDKLNRFVKKVEEEAPKPKIASAPQDDINPEFGVSFRFMPQRFTPDAEILQRLVSPCITELPKTRAFSMGLDVMAVLGSERAYQILDKILEETTKYTPKDDYPRGLKSLIGKYRLVEEDEWIQNLYWGWLYTLKSLLTIKGPEYPLFMQTTAWRDKELFTALGSWTELKHDTILYGKQPYGAEGGNGGERVEYAIVPKPKGYVEPNVELYERLALLTKRSQVGLQKRGLIDEELANKYSKLESLISFLEGVAKKQLDKVAITEEEYKQIRNYGHQLEKITQSVREGGIVSEADESVAVIADVLTNAYRREVLEEATGEVFPIYVVINRETKDYLTIGGVFSYYEFTHPMADRLTDEKWQAMIKQEKQPELPIWSNSFIEK